MLPTECRKAYPEELLNSGICRICITAIRCDLIHKALGGIAQKHNDHNGYHSRYTGTGSL
jgi:hypothetical protein